MIRNTSPSARLVELSTQNLAVDENGIATIVESASERAQDAGFGTESEGESRMLYQDDLNQLIDFGGDATLSLGPQEERTIDCIATLPPDTRSEQLVWVLATPEAEEMPTLGNTNVQVNVVFRVAARVFLIPGYHREISRDDGRTEVVIDRMVPPRYDVSARDVAAVVPKPEAARPVLGVQSILDNRSNTFVSPLIQARLRNVTTRTIVEEMTLSYGISMVLAGTVRRFTGEFSAPMEPGEYQLTVEADWSEGRPVRRTEPFTLSQPIAGIGRRSAGVIHVDQRSFAIKVLPGESTRGRLTVRNNYSEPVRVEPTVHGSPAAQ